ncbi:MAG: tetratricopeptide repeat protein [Micromonosporaceae bacterium]|nr:tetratricopeptide repeat protein [Micromonosporaceae bacterium]
MCPEGQYTQERGKNAHSMPAVRLPYRHLAITHCRSRVTYRRSIRWPAGTCPSRWRAPSQVPASCGACRSAGETLNDLGDAYRGLHRPPDAVAHYRQALTIRRDIGDLHGEAEALHNLGEVHQAQGATDAALHCYGQALAVWNKVGDRWAKARTVERIRALRE